MCRQTEAEAALPRFYHANIHEQRLSAYLVRALPMSMLVVMLAVVAFGVFRFSWVLLVICAILNVSMWLWIVSVSLFSIWGSFAVEDQLREVGIACLGANAKEDAVAAVPPAAGDEAGGGAKQENEPVPMNLASDVEGQDVVRHVVIFPNYEEAEEMLDETLDSLSEAIGSERFFVVLAMEAREKEARDKADRLIEKYQKRFARMMASYHQADLMEEHADGSKDYEVPGKASNLKCAVAEAYKACENDDQFSPENVVLTVADADCFFHPAYFAKVSGDYRQMRAEGRGQHRWTMWQAPQLPFRNYYLSPVPARVWGYISSLYEFGGVSGLAWGGHHMVFSAYSLHLQLGVEGKLWDGDVIAEDHHAYIKAFLYSAWTSAAESLGAEAGSALSSQGCRPLLKVQPVMLPVKSTSVVDANGTVASWIARWHQATRHCQGVAELSYSLLATWDLLCALPARAWTMEFAFRLFKVVVRPIFIHIVPICQAIALGVLTLYWFFHQRRVPHCPDRVWFWSSKMEVLCGLAGAWALMWPVMVPLMLLAISNFRFLQVAFRGPALTAMDAKRMDPKQHMTLWHASDGGVIGRFPTTAAMIFTDCAFLMGPIMSFYGLVAEVLGCWNVMLRGNRFKYITATKATSMAEDQAGYGTMGPSDAIAAPVKVA